MSSPVIHPLRSKLLGLMILRVVLALVFLGATVWLQLNSGTFITRSFHPLYVVVATVGLLTVLYASVLKHVKNLKLFTYAQVMVDIALVTGVVYVTGGIESYLPVLYFISVIGSTILLDRRGGYYAASVASISYGVLMDLDFYRVLPQSYKLFFSPHPPVWEDFIMTISTHILGFLTVAYHRGYLAEKASRMEIELETKEIDFDRLENLNRLIVDNIPSGIITLDGLSRVTSFNTAASAITGYSLREVYYRNIEDVFPAMGITPARSGARMEKCVRKKDGTEVCLGFTLSSGRGGEMTDIIILQDLTGLKAMEEQLRRDDRLKALGRLSAAIAHEIRNPLASLSGSVQVLSQELTLGAENRHLMDIVLRECDRLNSLITDFLLFARPATKEKPERVDVSEVIADTIRVFANSPQAARIDIENHIEGHLFVEGFRRQMSQVFWNLCVNAGSAMPGGGRLVVSSAVKLPPDGFVGSGALEKSRSPHGLVEILVMDTGEGVQPENLARIFDPFFSTRDSGTGMGLALVHRIIESHGGTIYVSSTPGEGTTFKIVLPLCAAAGPPAGHAGSC
ncbi:MAG: PAS domain S-box protein [Deltaproteobacteria bacterium]|nr:PAS domain S-box protein [Deltaproteobacteria bacterium]